MYQKKNKHLLSLEYTVWHGDFLLFFHIRKRYEYICKFEIKHRLVEFYRIISKIS